MHPGAGGLATWRAWAPERRGRGAPPPGPGLTPDKAYEELGSEAFPAFLDDLDWAGLHDALARSLTRLYSVARVDYARSLTS